MFRNARLYRVHSSWPESEEALHGILGHGLFQPCGSLSERSAGWESPEPVIEGREDPPLARRVAGADLLQLRHQTRVLPPAAVNEALSERLSQFQARTGRLPGRKEKRDLKEDVYDTLLPKALLKSDRVQGLYLKSERLLAIDTASDTVAELFLDQYRAAAGSLEATPLAFKRPIGELLLRVFMGDGPTELALSRECRMQDPANGKSSVSWLDMDLGDPQVRKHVQAGLAIDRLGIEFNGVVGCVLDRDAVLRKLKLLDTDGMDDLPDEEPLARLDAEIALTAGAIAGLCRMLKKVQGGYA